MKKLFLTIAVAFLSHHSFSQSLSLDDLKVALRVHKALTNNMLVNKGFKEGGFKTVGTDTVIYYSKGFDETLITGFTLKGPDDNKRHMTVTYTSTDLGFPLDFNKQIPDDMKLTSKENGVYSFENSEMFLQLTISENPKIKPYSVYILEKNPYRF